MGANSSSADHHAKWVSDTECAHGYSNFKVIKIRWIRVPLCHGFWRGTVEVLKWTPLGILRAATNGKDDLSHECIEITYVCQCCGDCQRFAAEIYGKNNAPFTCGHYKRYFGDERDPYEPHWMTIADVKRMHNENGKDYHFLRNNCSHWCGRLWNKLTSY